MKERSADENANAAKPPAPPAVGGAAHNVMADVISRHESIVNRAKKGR